MGKSPFLNHISRFIRLNGYRLRTEKIYLYWIKVYIVVPAKPSTPAFNSLAPLLRPNRLPVKSYNDIKIW